MIQIKTNQLRFYTCYCRKNHFFFIQTVLSVRAAVCHKTNRLLLDNHGSHSLVRAGCRHPLTVQEEKRLMDLGERSLTTQATLAPAVMHDPAIPYAGYRIKYQGSATAVSPRKN
jgi:hypothetical protein